MKWVRGPISPNEPIAGKSHYFSQTPAAPLTNCMILAKLLSFLQFLICEVDRKIAVTSLLLKSHKDNLCEVSGTTMTENQYVTSIIIYHHSHYHLSPFPNTTTQL